MINQEALILTGLEERILSRGGNLVEPRTISTTPNSTSASGSSPPWNTAGWVQAKAARLLGMTPRQIAYRIQQFSITMKKI